MTAPTIICAGGGTAGHVYPLLAVGNALKRKGYRVIYVGSGAPLERQIVGKRFEYLAIRTGKLRRYLAMENLADLFRLPLGIYDALKIIDRFQPAAIFAKGGFVAAPVVVASRMAKIPLIAHESDTVLGFANRLSARLADKVCVGWPLRYYPKSWRRKLVYTGTPIRPGLNKGHLAKDQEKSILILGGSQGAVSLNNLIAPILPRLLDHSLVTHSTGAAWWANARMIKETLPPKLAAHYQPASFLDEDLGQLIDRTTVVVSRAGANIINELAYYRKPVILVPLPSAAADHQRRNALALARANAAVLVEQRQGDLTLLARIMELLNSPRRRRELSAKIAPFFQPAATAQIVTLIEQAAKKD